MWYLTAPIRSRLSEAPARGPGPATRGVAAVFGLAARLRARPALHPRGTVVRAVVRRDGLAEPIGVPWIDRPGHDDALVRLSRAAGLPRPFPDVLGLAVRVDPDGDAADLLLSTTGRAPVARHVLWPRYDPRAATYTSVLPYRAPAGLVLLAAFPAAARAARPAFHLAVAAPAGRWRRFARLELAGTGHGDADLGFDPVRRPLPGLRLPEPLASLRAASYRASREGRLRSSGRA
ncbi:hypothetical protein [Cryptosporangium arvum]|uniref:hypothetical protein n=1 Tax=Cryptosporangium arvum TaxID=80871 RepID=UPI0004BA5F4C|nr:hypothetical protein [Cryptosporangium arvum]